MGAAHVMNYAVYACVCVCVFVYVMPSQRTHTRTTYRKCVSESIWCVHDGCCTLYAAHYSHLLQLAAGCRRACVHDLLTALAKCRVCAICESDRRTLHSLSNTKFLDNVLLFEWVARSRARSSVTARIHCVDNIALCTPLAQQHVIDMRMCRWQSASHIPPLKPACISLQFHFPHWH